MSHAPRTLNTRLGRCLTFTPLGLGTAPLGNLYAPISEADADATLAAAWSLGLRHFDTAPLYGLGLAETRLNRFLRDKPRDSYLLATKIGRVLHRAAPEQMGPRTHYFNTPSRNVVFDYGYDGVMRSIEQSLERLGVDRLDIVYAHDLGADTHGSRAASDARVREFMGGKSADTSASEFGGGYRALDQLRREGVIDAIGAGCNEWEVCEALIPRSEFDIFLLAGRYTLLEQAALQSFLPLCQSKGIGVVVGGAYNSGLMAGGTTYNYQSAPSDVRARVSQLKRHCAAHGVWLEAAALQLPFAHPAVVSVVVGAVSADEVVANVGHMATRVPSALWSELKAAGLLDDRAPMPPSVFVEDFSSVEGD
jgi:D-threo-aldose 1-dehydrogenase